MHILKRLFGRSADTSSPSAEIGRLLQDFSIEVTPSPAAKIDDFARHLPRGTLVYIAHIPGTSLDDMVATARRLRDDGMMPMPHIAARSLPSREALDTTLTRYRDEAGCDRALVLAGGDGAVAGPYDSSMAMLESGLFEKHGYRRLHVAGHPEGNRDISPDGTTEILNDALHWKQDFARRTGIEMAIVTQFAFDAELVLDWIARLREMGIDLPVHVGIAGPTRLDKLIRFAVSCGVGASISVIRKRAKDATKLMTPYTPDELLADFAARQEGEISPVARFHVFPLGGITAATDYTEERVNTARPAR